METRLKKEQMYQMFRLRTALTKQGFQFTNKRGCRNMLIFDLVSLKYLFRMNTNLPFVESITIANVDRKHAYIVFRISADNKTT